MTETEVLNEIYTAITMGRDDNGKPILRYVQIASEVAPDVLNALKAKGLLRMEVVVD